MYLPDSKIMYLPIDIIPPELIKLTKQKNFGQKILVNDSF